MTLETVRRWAVPGALLMAGAWFASGIVAWIMSGGPGPGEPGELRFFLIESLHGIGAVGMLAALADLHLMQRRQMGRWGSIGFKAAFVGTAAFPFSVALWFAFEGFGGEGNVITGLLTAIFFAAAMLGWLVGFTLFGIASLRARVFPAWLGVLLIAFFPIILIVFLVLLAYSVGGVMVGLLWLAIGYGLWAHERTAAGIKVEEAGAQTAGGG
jgi:hypothetical protein